METMADLVRGSLFEELKRDQMHSADIADALEFLRGALSRERIPFGLIGALALRHHGYSSGERDVPERESRKFAALKSYNLESTKK